MGHLAKPRDASFFRVFFNPYRYGVLTFDAFISIKNISDHLLTASFYNFWRKRKNRSAPLS